MAIPRSRRPRVDPDARAEAILETARAMAEPHGWGAVTTRSLSEAMSFTQPVLYRSFPSMAHVQAAVAERGFAELAGSLDGRAASVATLADAYLEFADAHHAVYEAMFRVAPGLGFATSDASERLQAAFALLLTATGDEARAELLWCALHGLVELERAGRVARAGRAARVQALVTAFGHPTAGGRA